MNTEKSLIDQIKSLSELEFAALMDEVAEHVRVSKFEHVVDSCFRCENEDELLQEISDLKEEVSVKKTSLEHIAASMQSLIQLHCL